MAHASATIGTTDYAVAITAGHHQLRADEGPALGGKDTAPGHSNSSARRSAPVPRSRCACMRKRKAWPLRGVEVDVRFSGTGKEGAIARVLKFDGDLSEEQRARLADIAERTPVTLTLKNGVAITTTLA